MKKKIKKTKAKLTPETLTIPCKNFVEKIGLTQSLMLTFQRCQREFILKVNGYRPKGKSEKFLFGSLCHEYLDMAYSGKKFTFAKFEERFRKKKMKEYVLIDESIVESAFALCEVVMELYMEHYKEDFTEKKFDGVEEEFEVLFNGATLRGKKDGCFYIDKKRWLMEHKTKSRFSEDALMLKLSFDFQNLMYIHADEIEHSEAIAGVLYNLIRKPGLRKGKYESLKEFCDRVRSDIKKRPEWYFIRWEVPYTKKDKARFIVELKQKIATIELACARNSFYKCENACIGMYTCDFLETCASNSLANLDKSDDIFPELDEMNIKEKLKSETIDRPDKTQQLKAKIAEINKVANILRPGVFGSIYNECVNKLLQLSAVE